MSYAGKWLGQVVGKWLGNVDGGGSGPTYVDAALVVEGSGSASISPLVDSLRAALSWLITTRRRLRR